MLQNGFRNRGNGRMYERIRNDLRFMVEKRAELFMVQNGRKKSREAIDNCVFLSMVVAGCYFSWFNIDAKSSKNDTRIILYM